MSIYDHDYSDISRQLNLTIMELQHHLSDLMFSFKILNGFMMSPDKAQLCCSHEMGYSSRVACLLWKISPEPLFVSIW